MFKDNCKAEPKFSKKMPPKKQKLEKEAIVNNSNDAEVTPLRRSRRVLAVDKASDQNPKISNENSISKQLRKPPKTLLKKIENKSSFESSPDSTDSGIGSGPSIEDVNCSPKLNKATIKSELSSSSKKPLNVTSLINDVGSQARDEKQSSKKTRGQKKSKRKLDDLGDTTVVNKNSISKKSPVLRNCSDELENEKDSKLPLRTIKTEDKTVDYMAVYCSSAEETVLQVLARHELEPSKSNVSITKTIIKKRSEDDSSSESDWEEVEERKELSLDDYNPEIPKDGVEITIDCPELNIRKRKKKQFDQMEYIRLYINRERKEHQLNIQKTHLLCLLAHGLFVNDILNSNYLKALALSLLPSDLLALTAGRKIDKIGADGIQQVVSWFCNSFKFENNQLPFLSIQKNFPNYFQTQTSLSASEYNLMFIVVARTLGFKTRFCISFYPVTHKPNNLLKKPGSKKKSSCNAEQNSEDGGVLKGIKKATENLEEKSKTATAGPKATKSKRKKLDVISEKKKTCPKRSEVKSYKMSSDENGPEDEDFLDETVKRTKQVKRLSRKSSEGPSNRKILSTDSEPSSPESCAVKPDKIVCWCEVFSKPEKQWISIECTHNIIDKPYDIEKLLPQPVTYIVCYDNNSYIKDVTKRYCSEYMTLTLKLRADSEWWEESVEYFAPPNSKLDKEEEKKLDELLVNKPLPKTIGEYKNHPLYALKRHLLKFEAIYPPDAAPVGFLREEPIYARDCVCQLHSRETWLKEARVVRVGEEPYKIVKARPKWDRLAGVMRTDLPLQVFGFWQTQEYEPPLAEGGKVPRNEYGNVELFKPCMLPRGTVHLQMPGLNRIAKKLGIDCSPAVVGFDGHKGSIHPVFDGFVVCKEFKDTLLAAWDEEQVNARKREIEKREKRIYGNWKKLIKGLLIRERIKLKYDVK